MRVAQGGDSRLRTINHAGTSVAGSFSEQVGGNSHSYQSYETRRQLGLSRFFKILRISYVAYCLLLLLLAQGYLQIGWPNITALTIVTVAYTIYRFFRRPSTFSKKRLERQLLLDSTDFILVTVLVYLTGGVQSFFIPAYSVPVIASTICYGLAYGFVSLFFSAILGCLAVLWANSYSLPVIFHILSISGTLAFAIWTISTVIANEMRLRDKLYRNSLIDQLTGLYHRGYACERINEEIKRCKRENGNFAIVFIDLDNFKDVNDRYGHLIGDQILKHTAGVLKQSVRGGETLTRYGGDEFILLLPGARRKEAEQVLNRLRKAVINQPYPLVSVPVCVGISGGTAEFPGEGDSLEQLLQVADSNMYREKC